MRLLALISNKLTVGGVAVISLLFGTSLKSQAGNFTADFTCGYDLGRALFPLYESNVASGFTYSFGTGSLSISQAAGIGNGGLGFATTFPIAGDFTASVVASGGQNLGLAETGLGVTDQFGHSLMDIFFQRTGGQIISNVFAASGPGVIGTGGAVSSSTTATFVISRTGNVLVTKYNPGSGLVKVYSSPDDPSYGVPVQVSLFLVEEFGDTGTHQSSFSSLKVRAASLGKTCVPPGL